MFWTEYALGISQQLNCHGTLRNLQFLKVKRL